MTDGGASQGHRTTQSLANSHEDLTELLKKRLFCTARLSSEITQAQTSDLWFWLGLRTVAQQGRVRARLLKVYDHAAQNLLDQRLQALIQHTLGPHAVGPA